MLHTIKGAYVPLRPATSTVDSTLSVDAYDWSAMPSTAFRTGEEWNNAEIIFKFPSTAADGDTADFNLWGYTEKGPKEWICEVSATAGTATFAGDATGHYGDTIVVATQGHFSTVSVNDSATNRIAKLTLDLGGYKYISAEFSAASLTGTVQPWGRPW
jgi:hypothetical protein